MMRHVTAALLLSASATSYSAAAQAQSPSGSEDSRQAPVNEQQAAVPAVSDADPDSTDIIVTAQRRPERLQDVPVSLTVVSSEMLEERHLKDLQQISLAAPSLQLGQENTYSIRGVGTLAFQQTVDPAVAISLDEVSLARNYLSESVFNDVAQVEVLSGPQGVLFGRNASGGLLNITTVMPKLNNFSGDGEVEYNWRDSTPGNGQGITARANLNIPIGDISALRVNGVFEFQEPVTQGSPVGGARSEANRKALEFRAKYLIEPTDALSIYLIGSYANRTGTAGLYDRTYRILAPNSNNIGPLARDGTAAGPNALEYLHDGDNYRDLQNYGVQGRVAYTLPNDWQIIDIAAYKGYSLDTAFDQDFTTSNGDSLSAQSSTFDQFSNELRLALPAGNRVTGQVGLFYLTFRENFASQNGGAAYLPGFLLPNFPFCVGAVVVAGPPPACSVSNDYFIGSDQRYTFESESYAGFGQLDFDLGAGFSAVVGGRWTHDDVSIVTTQNLLDYFVRFGGPRGTYAEDQSDSNFSYRLGLQYEPTRDLMFYGTYATGYKGPGLNNGAATAAADLAVDSETSRNIEVGAKTSWLDRRLTVNLALFQTKYRDYQASSFDPQSTSFSIRNAASLVSKGAEVSVNARPVKGLSINASATLLDSKFEDFPGAQCYAGQPSCAVDGTFDAAGLRTPLAAKFTSSIGINYEAPINATATLFVGGDWYHRSSVNFSIAPDPLTALGSIDLFGAHAGVELVNGVRLSVFCKNCTDKRVPTFIYPDPGDFSQNINSSVQTFGFNSVRSIGASIGFDF